MQDSDLIDENTLGAFVDGQLDSTGCEAVMVAMARDPAVRERVEQLRRAKDLMRVGFASAQAPSRRRPLPGVPVGNRLSRALAASVAALALGLAAGSLGYHYGRHLDRSELASLASSQQQHGNRIVLHISEANPIQFAAALSYADKFLRRHPAPDSRVEVIANAGGLDMMRTGLSPYEDQIDALLKAHPNVRFLACANAIANLRKRGIEPQVIASVDTEKKAIDHIVARLQEGWSYVRVDALPEI
jgi:intracellular sulfur oxidation DsrE/DsrF family protein